MNVGVRQAWTCSTPLVQTTYLIRCRRAPKPKHVRPMFPVLAGIRGRKSTTCSIWSPIACLSTAILDPPFPAASPSALVDLSLSPCQSLPNSQWGVGGKAESGKVHLAAQNHTTNLLGSVRGSAVAAPVRRSVRLFGGSMIGPQSSMIHKFALRQGGQEIGGGVGSHTAFLA